MKKIITISKNITECDHIDWYKTKVLKYVYRYNWIEWYCLVKDLNSEDNKYIEWIINQLKRKLQFHFLNKKYEWSDKNSK